MKKLILSLTLVASLIGAPIYGRSSGSSSSSFSSSRPSSSSSGFRSSSSSSGSSGKSWGSSAPSSSPSKSWGASTKSTSPSPTPGSSTKSSIWGGSTKTVAPIYTKTNGTKVDESVYKKAVQSGTVFKSKTDAVNDFKSKNASKFANKFDAEPAARPSYIPASTSVGGNTYNVSYNSQHHGYGYYGPSGAWIAYDALRDVAMLSVLMDHDNYVVAPPNSTVVHHSMGFIGWFFTILVVAVLIGSAIIVFSSR